VPHETQAPIPVGGEFTYRIQFPDPGLYWYHPHIREDYTQEMGLYGNIVVVAPEPDYWPPADRDVVLTLDDILLEDGKVAPFSPSETTYAAMGRFGNLMLVGGETDYRTTARVGEVVRLWLTNTANTRVFNVRIPGVRMKLVGGDSGRVEREEFVEEVLLAPSERAVVDVLVDRPGELVLEHRTPDRSYPLATVSVADGPVESSAAAEFEVLREAPELAAERRSLRCMAGCTAGQDPRPGCPDGRSGNLGKRRAGHVRLPDASGGDQRRAGPLPQVRHETHGRADRHPAGARRPGRDAPRRSRR
jgi:FtsP/CotA-like multicopper oxidase with cupredoxin domain